MNEEVKLKRILVIDDDEKVGEMLQAMLENHGFQVEYVRDGKKGLEIIKGTKPDLVLMDLLMPGIHGFDLCNMIKKNEEIGHIPVVAVSAVYKQAVAGAEIKAAGIDAFVEKPINFARLLEKVENLLPG